MKDFGDLTLYPSYSDPLADRIARFDLSPAIVKKIAAADRCFILGMGPSLNKIDPEALKNEFVIGTNFIERTQFKSDIICVVDNRRFDRENWEKSKTKIVTVKQISERRGDQMKRINYYDDINYVDYDNNLTKNILKVSDFDEHLADVHFSGSVITDLAIPLASYLGMKKIYVLGLDGAVASFPSTHIIGNEANYQVAHSSKLFHMHEKTAQVAKRRGVSVYNASPGGIVSALEKVSIDGVKKGSTRRAFDGNVDGKYIAFDSIVVKLIEGPDGIRLLDEKSKKFIRHKHGRVFLDKDDGTPIFVDDSAYQVEPSFVRQDWVSFRSKNLKNRFITALDETSGYRVRVIEDVFSPYFSSFRLYDTPDRAMARIQHMSVLKNLTKTKEAIGNAMLADDKL